jgi:hypothetical protein
MDYELKTVKKTLPPRLFFFCGVVCGVLVGTCVGSLGGFCAVLYVESDGNSWILFELISCRFCGGGELPSSSSELSESFVDGLKTAKGTTAEARDT